MLEGLQDVAFKMLSEDEYIKAMQQHTHYRNGLGVWARQASRVMASKLAAHDWWMQCGGAAPELQKVAIRVLSQGSSACCCERNWSTYKFIHSSVRNRLDPARAEKLVYVHTNMRLLDRIQAVDYEQDYPAWPSSDSEGEEDAEEGGTPPDAWVDEESDDALESSEGDSGDEDDEDEDDGMDA